MASYSIGGNELHGRNQDGQIVFEGFCGSNQGSFRAKAHPHILSISRARLLPMTSLPLVLQFKKVNYGGHHTYTYIRASSVHEWEQTVEVNGLIVMWTIVNFIGPLVGFLDQHSICTLYRTKFVIGECLMWTLFTHGHPDLAIKLPVLRTLNSSRLFEREMMRQEVFGQVLDRGN